MYLPHTAIVRARHRPEARVQLDGVAARRAPVVMAQRPRRPDASVTVAWFRRCCTCRPGSLSRPATASARSRNLRGVRVASIMQITGVRETPLGTEVRCSRVKGITGDQPPVSVSGQRSESGHHRSIRLRSRTPTGSAARHTPACLTADGVIRPDSAIDLFGTTDVRPADRRTHKLQRLRSAARRYPGCRLQAVQVATEVGTRALLRHGRDAVRHHPCAQRAWLA